MITPKEIEIKTMSESKRKEAKNDFFAFYIGRPITYILTIPFLYTNISPNVISMLSVIPVLAGFSFLMIGTCKTFLFLGWMGFFLWSMLDGIDGNVARYKKEFSPIGDALDAASGYFAMALIFLGAGISAAHMPGIMNHYLNIPSETYIILGGLSGIWTVLPRLIMHKAITSSERNGISKIKNRSEYGIAKLIALNITSIPGCVQLLLLVSIIANTLDIYTIVYFLINMLVMIMSIKSIFFKEKE
jgi:phosphatidylglycerophosphate synthase